MKRMLLFTCSVLLLAGILVVLASDTSAQDFYPTFVAPGYTAIEFVTLTVNTAAIEFDEEGNIYTPNGDLGSGLRTLMIWKYDAPDYEYSGEYATVSTSARGINGLAFDDNENLFVSLFDYPEDSGYMRKIGSPKVISTFYYDNGSQVDFRPTGITALENGHLYFPGRKWSDPNFGNLYGIASFEVFPLNQEPDIIRPGVVLTALTMDDLGMLYGGSRWPDNSIYTRDPFTDTPIKIASFNQYVEELSFWQGNIYALEARDGDTETDASIIEIFPSGIDVKPGSFPNFFNQNEHGALPVAIFGAPNLDVAEIDPNTLSLQGLSVKVAGRSEKNLSHTEYVNGDEYVDLVVQFEDSDGWMEPGNGYVFLEGQLYDGTFFWAGDTISIVPPEE